MPDARLQRARATLPEGYQYGDAGKCRLDKIYGAMCSTCWSEMIYQPVLHAWVCQTCPARIDLPWTSEPWRAPHENAAAQLKRQARSNEGAFKVGVPNLQVGPTYKAQRTGDETV